MLKGKKTNLNLVEKKELSVLAAWFNDLDFVGQFEPIPQESLGDWEKRYDDWASKDEGQCFFIEKKDGKKIGVIMHVKTGGRVGICYDLLGDERGKGCGTEAVEMIVDYLFLTKNIVRIQAETDPENKASWRVLEKAGFSKEGLMRKAFFSHGQWKDTALYSILKEDWKEPKILPQHN